jgi:NAD(P)H-hydrate epimerase
MLNGRISTIELMENAAMAIYEYITHREFFSEVFIFCGTGNNGGDGLCLARLLQRNGDRVTVFVAGDQKKATENFHVNMQRLVDDDVRVVFLSQENPFDPEAYEIDTFDLVIDCLFGHGLNRPIVGWMTELITQINNLDARILAVDLPSGLLGDEIAPQSGAIIKADLTLSIEIPKRSLLIREHKDYVGQLENVAIGLSPEFSATEACDWNWYDSSNALSDLRTRNFYTHKYEQGHLLLVAGSRGKMGAAVLCATAAMRTGVGLVTAHIPSCGYEIMQNSLPEAVCSIDENHANISQVTIPPKTQAMVIGPGLGQAPETVLMLRKLLRETSIPMVLDADALNILGSREFLDGIPEGAIITPHTGEFERMFGTCNNTAERITKMREMAAQKKITIVLKEARTMIAHPDGRFTISNSGHNGMATAGSGDVLAGVIGALLAGGYPTRIAAELGVWLHGEAGILCSMDIGPFGYLASDIAFYLPQAIQSIHPDLNIG